MNRGVVPTVVVCGGGAAGVELSFAFKKRWSAKFGQEIDVSIITHSDDVLKGDSQAVREEVRRKLDEKNIKIFFNGKVDKITATSVHLEDGRVIPCTVSIWATGAEPHTVVSESE